MKKIKIKTIPLEGTAVELGRDFVEVCLKLGRALRRIEFKIKVRDREVAL